MVNNTVKCIDPRGTEYLQSVFGKIAKAMGCVNAKAAVDKFDDILASLSLNVPESKEEDYEVLKTSVNPTRLKNNPVELDMEAIDSLYHQILRG
jgi:alcohol dehydrogenase class IV